MIITGVVVILFVSVYFSVKIFFDRKIFKKRKHEITTIETRTDNYIKAMNNIIHDIRN